MINLAREPLRVEVEIDDTWVGGTQAGIRGSRQLKGRRAALGLVPVEKRGKASGRLRMVVIPDFKANTINRFLTQNVASGATIYTDGLKRFTGLEERRRQPMAASKPSLALELSTIPHPTRRSEGPKSFQSRLPCLALPIPASAFLKQPDKQTSSR